MRTIRLQATIQEIDLPYIERFLKGISASEVSFEEEDFSQELSLKDTEKIERGREQIKKGLTISSSELQKQTREKYGSKMGY